MEIVGREEAPHGSELSICSQKADLAGWVFQILGSRAERNGEGPYVCLLFVETAIDG